MNFNYTPEKIMLQLGLERLKAFQQFWEENDGLEVTTFTQLIVDTLGGQLSDDEKYELVDGCVRLFAEVDINGDGGMDWSEFMQYMIDAVSGNTLKRENDKNVQQQLNQIKASEFYRFNLTVPHKNLNQNQIIQAINYRNKILFFILIFSINISITMPNVRKKF